MSMRQAENSVSSSVQFQYTFLNGLSVLHYQGGKKKLYTKIRCRKDFSLQNYC